MLDKSILFAQGKATELFETFVSQMTQNASPDDLENLMANAKPQVLGPQIKNEYTMQFEEIIIALLRNNPPAKFKAAGENPTVQIGSKTYELKKILNKMQRTQIHLPTRQLAQYHEYIEMEGFHL